eukprot:11889226-Prorocentrum_lima.AAC.1
MWNPPDENGCIKFEERPFPDERPDSLRMEMHEHDTTGGMEWNRFHHGLQTTETTRCPLEE